MQERRLFERIGASMKIKYEVIDKPPQAKTGTSKDISGTGIRLALDEKLEEGTNLKLSIELPGEQGRVASAYGKVIWSKKIEISDGQRTSNYYETGIQFTKADPLTLGKIFKYFAKK